MRSDQNERIDRVVLLSLVPVVGWVTSESISVQLGVSPTRIEAALADVIAGGEQIEASSQGYRRQATRTRSVASADQPARPAPIPVKQIVNVAAPADRHPQRAPSPITMRTPEPAASSTFGHEIRTLRIGASLSQNALAKMAGIDPAYVNRIERDPKTLPLKRVVLSLAEALTQDAAATDRLLYLAGLAPLADWQTRYEQAEAALERVAQALAYREPAARTAVAS